jgi:serine/threonine-protein kinase
LRWLVDVARALAAAHDQGLVHRDVKPENVMITKEGEVKVVDFGIARPTTSSQQGTLSCLTETGTLLGTPLYMAPEQLRGEHADARTDQFAWGVLAHELLTGACPWRGTGAECLAAIQRDDLPALASSVPRRVRACIRRSTAKDREKRFSSMDDLVHHLGPLESSGSFVRSRTVWATAMSAAVLATVALTAVRAASRSRTTAIDTPPPAASIASPARTPPAEAVSIAPTAESLAAPVVPSPGEPRPSLRSRHPSVSSHVPAIPHSLASPATSSSSDSPWPNVNPFDVRR